jgi:hypothetical protein
MLCIAENGVVIGKDAQYLVLEFAALGSVFGWWDETPVI